MQLLFRAGLGDPKYPLVMLLYMQDTGAASILCSHSQWIYKLLLHVLNFYLFSPVVCFFFCLLIELFSLYPSLQTVTTDQYPSWNWSRQRSPPLKSEFFHTTLAKCLLIGDSLVYGVLCVRSVGFYLKICNTCLIKAWLWALPNRKTNKNREVIKYIHYKWKMAIATIMWIVVL